MERLKKILQHLSNSKYLNECSSPKELRRQWNKTDVPKKTLKQFLENDNHELRQKMRNLINFNVGGIFTQRFNLTLDEQREIAMKRLNAYCSTKSFSVKNFLDNPRAIFAAHDFAIESGIATKMTVQFNLFGGSVLKLGTNRHHHLIDGIDQVKEIGCFALTELGYGNNAAKMETIAVLDISQDEWIVNTPTVLSQKYWITNGAVHAHWSIVFAQMIIKNKNYGVHAFLVPIRNQDLTVCTGVKIEDMGMKFGCNGVDNAKLQFRNVRIPRTALLNRYSNVEKDGKFTSEINKKRDRFLKVADQLLSGRICICCMTMCSDRIVLATTLLYSASRLTIGDSGQSNYPILGYQLQQNAIMPLIAAQVSLNIGLNHVKDRYSGIYPNFDHQELVIYCCVIKPLVTWHCNESANISRERCGGQGYLSINRVAEGIPGAHAGMTAEGDNRVLAQKTCKELLEKLKKGEYRFPEINKSINLNNLISLYHAFVQRESILFTKLSFNLKSKLIKGENLFNIWSLQYQDLVQESAEAFGERIVLQQCLKSINNNPELKNVLTLTTKLYAIYRIKKDLGFFLSNKILTIEQGKNIREIFNKLCKNLADISISIIEAWDIPINQMGAVAQNWHDFNLYDNKGEIMYHHPLQDD